MPWLRFVPVSRIKMSSVVSELAMSTLKLLHWKSTKVFSNVRYFHCSRYYLLNSVYSKEEQDQILQFINGIEPSQISRYKLPASFKKIWEFRQKNGPVTELDSLLEIKGITSKPAISLCNSILKKSKYLMETPELVDKCQFMEKANARVSDTRRKSYKNLLQPELRESPSRFAAINISSHYISWTVLEKQTTWEHQALIGWDLYSICNEQFAKVNLVHEILSLEKVLPIEDVYVMRNHNSGRRISNPVTDQLFGVVLSLLCSKQNFNVDTENSIFLLKAGTTGRMFELYVGNETVSVQRTVTNFLLDKTQSAQSNSKFGKSLLDLSFDNNLITHYLKQTESNKEVMTKSLLLGMTFAQIIHDISLENLTHRENFATSL